jgi:hypothetical protein
VPSLTNLNFLSTVTKFDYGFTFGVEVYVSSLINAVGLCGLKDNTGGTISLQMSSSWCCSAATPVIQGINGDISFTGCNADPYCTHFDPCNVSSLGLLLVVCILIALFSHVTLIINSVPHCHIDAMLPKVFVAA